MLQAIRAHAQGWFAWVIVVLISVPFALWGIQEYIKGGSQQPVAKVNGHDISDQELSTQVRQARMNLRSRLGKAYRPELIDQSQLRSQVLEDLIRNQLTIDSSVNMGLRVGDEQVRDTILAIPAFQKDGQFDNSAYEHVLSMQGTTTLQFEQRVRYSLMSTQLNRVISSSEFATNQDLNDSIKLHHQQRSFKYFLMPLADFKTDVAITDTELNDYYQSHRSVFAVPEQVKLDYLTLGPTDGPAVAEPTYADLQAIYQTNIQQYQTPEQRQLRHILITLDPKATPSDESTARKKIEAVRARIAGGADFATVAKEVSQDPGSAAQGGDLGLVGRGIMDSEFERAAFALPKGKLSEPVRSAFGLHLIEVTEIQPERTKPFAEVRKELAASAKADELSKRYLSTAERLGNMTYEHLDSLEPAAQSLGLKIQHSDWISRLNAGAGFLSDPKVISSAFSDEVLAQGNNSELIEIADGHEQRSVVLRVVEHKDASTKSLAEVKNQIIDTLRQDRAKQAAIKQAELLVERLRKGEAIAQVAKNYKITEQALAQRDAIKNVPTEILERVFKLLPVKPPGSSTAAVQLQNGTASVVVLGAIKYGLSADLDAAKRKDESKNLAKTQANAYYDDMLKDLKGRADIWIAPVEDHQLATE